MREISQFKKLPPLKKWIFTFMQAIQNTQPTSGLFYKLILLIETYQFAWYAIDPVYFDDEVNQVNNWVGNVIKSTQVDGLLDQENQQVSLFLLYCFFSLQVLSSTLAVLSTIIFKRNRQKISRNMHIFLKISSIVAIITNTVFVLPFCNMFFATLVCTEDHNVFEDLKCYEGVYILHCIVSVIGLLLLTIFSVIFSLLFIDMNPFSSFPLAAPHSRFNFYKFWLKFLLPLYSILPMDDYSKIFLIVYIIIALAILVTRYLQPPYFIFPMFRFLVGIESLLFWIALNELMTIELPDPDGDYSFLIFFCGLAICLIYGTIRVIERRIERFQYKSIKSFTTDSEVETQVGLLLNLIKHRKRIDNFMTLEGILRLHIKHCQELGCSCQHLIAFTSDTDYQEKLWYQWVKTLINQGIEKFPKSARLRILSSNLKREKLNGQFQALFDLSSISTTRWTIDQEYTVFKGRDIIEQQMTAQDKLKSEERGVDFNKVISFHKNVSALETLLIEATENYLDFWTELSQTAPKVETLDLCGASILATLDKISKKYRQLTKVNPFNNELIKMYGSFQKEVVNNQKEAKRELEKLESTATTLGNKRLRHNSEYKIIDNPNICLITVSGHIRTMGLVKDVTNEVTKILGYSKSELIGENINTIMPKVIRDLHDKFMSNYFETSHANTLGAEVRVFPLNKSGYITPCNLLVHLVPKLDEGITLVGFLAEAQYDSTKQKHYYKNPNRAYYIMYNAGTQVIQGVSETCYEDFGIPSSLVDDTEMTDDFTVDKILPEIEDLSEDELKGPNGVVTILDTTNLHEEFLIPDPESLDPRHNDPEDQGSIQIYRRARVCATIIEESRYGEALVRVIKLVELPDEDDAQGELAFRLQNRKGEISTDTVQTESRIYHFNYLILEIAETSDIESVSKEEHDGTIGSLLSENVGELAYIKSLTSRKSTMKTIRGLAIAGFAVTFLVIGFEIFQYVIFCKQRQEFEGGLVNLDNGYWRHGLLAVLNFRVRQLDLLAKYQLSSSTQTSSQLESTIRGYYSQILEIITAAEYDLVVFGETHADDDSFSVINEQYLFELMQDGNYKVENLLYEDAFMKYLAAATQIRNASLDKFIPNPNIIDPTVDNFFAIRKNGLGPLRDGSDALIGAYYAYYLSRVNYYKTYILIGLILTLLMIVLSRTLMIVNLLSAIKTNYKAFSVLGYVSPEITQQLIDKCQKYLDKNSFSEKEAENKNLMEAASQSSQRNDSEANKSHESNDNQRCLSQKNHDENISQYTHQMENSEFQDVSENVKIAPMVFLSERRNAIASPSLSSHRGLLEPDSARVKPFESRELSSAKEEPPEKVPVLTLKMNTKKEEVNENFEEIIQDRIQKLQDDVKSQKTSSIIRMFIAILPWLLLHTLEYTLFLQKYFNYMELSFKYLQVSAYQQANIWYLNAYSLEEIAEAGNLTSVYVYPEQTQVINQRLQYKSYVQSKLKALVPSLWEGLPDSFTSYLTLYNYALNGNLCSDVFLIADTEADCTAFANGLMTQGITMVMTTLLLDFDDVMLNFQNALALIDETNSTQVNQTIYDALSSVKYQETEPITMKLSPILESLKNTYQAAFISFLDTYQHISLIKFVVVIVGIILISIILWFRFGMALTSKLLRTRKILALMPFELFMKNKTFRKHFLSEE